LALIDLEIHRSPWAYIPSVNNLSNIPVKVSVFDLRGKLLQVLIDKNMQPGYHKIRLAGKSPTQIPTLYKINARGFSKTVKVFGIK
jgi:hypothetical protein